MSFQVGQKVMCIRDDLVGRWTVKGQPLVMGQVYTVREARSDLRHELTEQPLGALVRLVENEISLPPWPGEKWWVENRFRALDDVSVTEEEHISVPLRIG